MKIAERMMMMPEVRLIDANALIAEYDRVHVGAPGGARKLMQDAPTIEPEVRHGRWIDTPIGNTKVAECSLCGFWQRTNGDDKTGNHMIHKAVYKYCAGCGAKMDATDTNVGSKGGAENG